MGRNQRDEPTQVWTTSNVTTDRTIDADGTLAVIGDGLTTLIEDLRTAGVLA